MILTYKLKGKENYNHVHINLLYVDEDTMTIDKGNGNVLRLVRNHVEGFKLEGQINMYPDNEQKTLYGVLEIKRPEENMKTKKYIIVNNANGAYKNKAYNSEEEAIVEAWKALKNGGLNTNFSCVDIQMIEID